MINLITKKATLNLKAIVKLIRVHQWIKNLLVFAPIFFAGQFQTVHLLQQAIIAFFAFSFVASSVYVLNDYFDIEKDKLHPTKKTRPLASGVISKAQGRFLFVLLLIVSFLLTFLVNVKLLAILSIYLIINILYTIRLKHIALLDISIIAFGFLLRIAAGSYPIDILVSKWLIILIFLLAMFMGIAKRRGELIHVKGTATRASLQGYNLQFIDTAMVIMASVTVVAYIMYTVSPEVVKRIGSDDIYLTTFFVVLGILRYLQLTIVFEKTESPTMVFLTDRFMQLNLIGWGVLFGYFLYY